MHHVPLDLENLHDLFPPDLTEDQIAQAQTAFLEHLSLEAHRFYAGKMITVPKAGLYGFNWFNVYYTPGVSKVSTTIRDHNDLSFDLTNRGNLVAIVSDSTRVLGDGDVTPSGGLGVMEGKAFLMKHLGGVDASAICMDSRNAAGEHDPERIIEFVKMLSPSFGAVNLEDISQPNCYRVLDELQDAVDIPVWHDDAQGTGLVTLAGLLNALKIVGKEIGNVSLFLLGAGAANTTIARLLLLSGADPDRMILCDSHGPLHADRSDLASDPRFYRKWELANRTNPRRLTDIDEAVRGADVLISLSRPGPGTVQPAWIKAMADNPIVFACANPVPEIYPHVAKAAGAAVVATGRGDFPNQVNNSIGFPGVLKGALLVRARKITDHMAIAAARSLAATAERRGITPDSIIPKMDEASVFPEEAAEVAMRAIEDGVARRPMPREDVVRRTEHDIREARRLTDHLMEHGFIHRPPRELLDRALAAALRDIQSSD